MDVWLGGPGEPEERDGEADAAEAGDGQTVELGAVGPGVSGFFAPLVVAVVSQGEEAYC